MAEGTDVYRTGPPVPLLKESYVTFKKEVNLWQTISSVPVPKQAGTLLLRLPEKAKSVALEMDLNVLQNGVTSTAEDGTETTKNGVKCLLEELDKIYLDDIAREKFTCYDSFRKLSRDSSQNIKDYVLEFEKHVKRLQEFKIELPSAVLAYELLRSANVSEYKYSVAVAIVGELTYENMKDTVRRITEIDEPSMPGKVVEKSNDFIKVKIEDDCPFYSESENYNNYFDSVENQENTAYFGGGRNRGGRKTNFRGRNYRQPSQGNWRSRNTAQESLKKLNPKDRYGNYMKCHHCQSICHFSKECPEISNRKDQYYNENVSLFQNLPEETTSTDIMVQFTCENFGLAVLDSGCNVTVCGEDWLKVYLESLNETDLSDVKYEGNEVSFRFGDNAPVTSSTKCTFPAFVCNKKVKIAAQVVSDQIPLLISKQTMKSAKMVLNFCDDTVEAFGCKQNIIFTNSGHCSIPLSKYNVFEESCVCNADNIALPISILDNASKNPEKMATKLHKQFGHPNPEGLKHLIKTAGKLTKDLSKYIDEVTAKCDICRRYKKPANRPVVCMPLAKDFNDTVAMDIKEFDKAKNIYFQHMIDHKTRFSTAKMVKSKNREVIVDSVMTHWIALFGKPKKFLTDNGGEYVNSSFMDLCEKLDVHVATTGAEAPWSNGLVERHHALLSSSVEKIIEDTGCSIETALAWAVHAKNSLSNINGFSPYQLLLGKNPVTVSLDDPYISPLTVEDESPSEKVAEHIKSIYAARHAQMQSEAQEKIRRAIRNQTREAYSENIDQGDLVYYKRDNSKRWRGPGTVAGIDGKLIFVRHGGYLVRCHRTKVVRVTDLYEKPSVQKCKDPPPLIKTVENETNITTSHSFDEASRMISQDLSLPSENISVPSPQISADHQSNTEDLKELQQLCTKKCQTNNKKPVVECIKTDMFHDEKLAELEKWKVNDVFEEFHVNDMNEDEVAISTRWVLSDNAGVRKARLVARGFEEEPLNDSEKVSPTCRKESLRLLFSLAATYKWNLQSLDISAAFLQGKEIERTVYIIPPREFQKVDVVWKLKKCVYGLSDAARMWYCNVKEQLEAAGLIKCPYDDALFYRKTDGVVDGMMTIHVDDFVYSGSDSFNRDVKSTILKDFVLKSNEKVNFTYLGLEVEQNEYDFSVKVSQKKYIEFELSPIPLSSKRKQQKTYAVDFSEYKKLRAGVGQILWISLQTRPDLSFEACQLSNHLSDPNVADLVRFNKIVKDLKDNNDVCLIFKRIPGLTQTPKITTYSDAAFGNLPKQGSQCGYIIFLTDSEGINKNPIAWKSVKLDRVCQSTVGAESLALIKAIDHTLFIRNTFTEITGINQSDNIECFVDNKGLLELVYKTKDPTEKRLICTMASIREMIEKKEISVTYIPSKEMPADILTKRGPNGSVILQHLKNNS